MARFPLFAIFNCTIRDNQRLALVYLRHNDQITNNEYQRLNHVDSVTANRELRGLVQTGLIQQHETRRWAYYTLRFPQETTPVSPRQTDEEKVVAYVREHGSISNGECCSLLGVNAKKAQYLLQKLCKRKLLKRRGERRWTRYILT